MKNKLIQLAVLAPFLLTIASPISVQAQTRAWSDINPACVDNGVATIQGAECIVTNFLNIAVSLVGIAAFIMLLVGSMIYLSSGGNPKATETGSKTISYAIRGILVAVSGWIVINFVATFTGVETIKIFSVIAPHP